MRNGYSFHFSFSLHRELTPARGRWLYALLARLEKPLHREAAACIRQLYRRCCSLRYSLSLTSASVNISDTSCMSVGNIADGACLVQLSGSGVGQASDDSGVGSVATDAAVSSAATFQDRLAALNLLISICGSYFGQGEEYDAFNSALMREAAQFGEQGGDEEEEDEEGEEGSEYEDDDDEYEEDDEEDGNVMITAEDDFTLLSAIADRSVPTGGEHPRGSASDGWVQVTTSIVSTSRECMNSSSGLEEGEEEEEDDMCAIKKPKSST